MCFLHLLFGDGLVQSLQEALQSYRRRLRTTLINEWCESCTIFIKNHSLLWPLNYLPLQRGHGPRKATFWVFFHSDLCSFWQGRSQLSIKACIELLTIILRDYGGSQYLQSNVSQDQTVIRHLTLHKAHGLKLRHGKQLTSRVDYLALYRYMHTGTKIK